MTKAMKKISVFVVAIMTLLMSLFCFASCGEKGVYKMTSYQYGDTVKMVDSTKEEFSYVELKKGNVATVDVNEALLIINVEGSWKRDGDNIIITQVASTGSTEVTTTHTMSIDGKKIVWVYTHLILGEITMTFEKA